MGADSSTLMDGLWWTMPDMYCGSAASKVWKSDDTGDGWKQARGARPLRSDGEGVQAVAGRPWKVRLEWDGDGDGRCSVEGKNSRLS